MGTLFTLLTYFRDWLRCVDKGSPNPYYYNTMEFDSGNKHVKVIFDTEVYVCNDNGKTVEKISCNQTY